MSPSDTCIRDNEITLRHTSPQLLRPSQYFENISKLANTQLFIEQSLSNKLHEQPRKHTQCEQTGECEYTHSCEVETNTSRKTHSETLTEIESDNVQGIEQLTLVLVNAFDLHIKHGVRWYSHLVLLLQVGCQFPLVVLPTKHTNGKISAKADTWLKKENASKGSQTTPMSRQWVFVKEKRHVWWCTQKHTWTKTSRWTERTEGQSHGIDKSTFTPPSICKPSHFFTPGTTAHLLGIIHSLHESWVVSQWLKLSQLEQVCDPVFTNFLQAPGKRNPYETVGKVYLHNENYQWQWSQTSHWHWLERACSSLTSG